MGGIVDERDPRSGYGLGDGDGREDVHDSAFDHVHEAVIVIQFFLSHRITLGSPAAPRWNRTPA